MKKNFKSNLRVTVIGYILLQAITFCFPLNAKASVEAAIRELDAHVINALNGSITPTARKTSILDELETIKIQMNRQFDKTFVGEFNYNMRNQPIGNPTDLSTIDKKINKYANEFYDDYTTESFLKILNSSLNFSEIKKDVGTQPTAVLGSRTQALESSKTFIEKSADTDDQIKNLLAREIGYNTQRDLKDKYMDTNELLAEPMESLGNNIDRSVLEIRSKKEDSLEFGGLDDRSPQADKVPSLSDLIGPDSYDKEQTERAKLFLSYLLKALPPMKNIYIPPPVSPSGTSEKAIKIQLPYPKGNVPYTESPKISITKVADRETGIATSEYDKVLKYLSGNLKYQKYKMKFRSSNMLRSIYLENLYRLYQARTKDLNNKNSKSLVEKEKILAFEGLTTKYYNDLKKQSTADVNLATLLAINKVVYFLYKLHEDSERMALITTINTLKQIDQEMLDENEYFVPIGKLIENRCWLPEQQEKEAACAKPEFVAAS